MDITHESYLALTALCQPSNIESTTQAKMLSIMFTDLMLPACLPDASERLLRGGEGCQSESLLSET